MELLNPKKEAPVSLSFIVTDAIHKRNKRDLITLYGWLSENHLGEETEEYKLLRRVSKYLDPFAKDLATSKEKNPHINSGLRTFLDAWRGDFPNHNTTKEASR